MFSISRTVINDNTTSVCLSDKLTKYGLVVLVFLFLSLRRPHVDNPTGVGYVHFSHILAINECSKEGIGKLYLRVHIASSLGQATSRAQPLAWPVTLSAAWGCSRNWNGKPYLRVYIQLRFRHACHETRDRQSRSIAS